MRLAVDGRGKAQQRAHQLMDAPVKVVHIGLRGVEIEIARQHLLLMKYRRLIVDKALQVDIQRLSNVVEGLDVDGDGAVFVLGKGGLALVDHGRKLLDGVATALAVLLDPLAHMIGKGTHR